ncbi:MAG: peptidylprolyl isomerase [Algibacter sp.]|uniref:peptidylprolyl isomerase n=1 Tax=Algibacter sp. TaxID=1872428 RepID=UPI0026102A5F|nr:peptidylprolyl isomerase [Algibacter sp.]MDG1730065.1 peptidylprolyl isomerase [Algibacter sp.]MDG2179807.1 peptidylprolyl isomerase [Algibacter sp.]
MFKKLLVLLVLSTSSFLAAQTSAEEALKTIETPEQIKSYLESKKSKKNKLITFNEEKHKTILAKDLFKLSVGGTKVNEREFEKTFYKVINKSKKTYYRAACIYLNGEKNSIHEIEEMRAKIIAQFNNGLPFDLLAKRYSKDENSNKGGDIGWLLKEDVSTELESQLIDNKNSLNSIFNVDVPSENAYYVVLKTHEPKDISEIEVLKIVEAKE